MSGSDKPYDGSLSFSRQSCQTILSTLSQLMQLVSQVMPLYLIQVKFFPVHINWSHQPFYMDKMCFNQRTWIQKETIYGKSNTQRKSTYNLRIGIASILSYNYHTSASILSYKFLLLWNIWSTMTILCQQYLLESVM